MNVIYPIFREWLISLSVLYYYGKASKQKMQESVYIIVPFTVSLTAYVVNNHFSTFTRIFISFLLLSLALLAFQKKIMWIYLVLSFSFNYFLFLVAVLVSMFVLVVSGLDYENEFLVKIITSLLLVSTFAFIPVLERNKKINIQGYTQYLNQPFVRKIMGVVGILIFMLLAFINISASLEVVNVIEFFWFMLILGVLILVAVAFLVIFIVKHLNSEKKQRNLLEEENERVNQEYNFMQMQMQELNQIYADLKKDFGDVTSTHHSYRYIIPVLINMQYRLLENMNKFSDFSYNEKSVWIHDYTNEIKTLLTEIDVEMADDVVKATIKSLNIPEKWSQLHTLLEKLYQKADEHGVYLSVNNYSKNWNNLIVSGISFIRLFSNIVDNAIKETSKLPKEERAEIRIVFKDDETGNLAFEVFDGADEFSITILKKLGMRKNSTNRTGDGYAEIINDLEKTKASFLLLEWYRNNKFGKSITITFDNYECKIIDSFYRSQLLTEVFKNSEFEIIPH